MVGIKIFDDGPRKVIVLEGLGDIDVKEVIKDITAKIVNNEYKVEELEPVEAEPISEETNMPMIPTTFSDGPYQGMTPAEILNNEDKESTDAAISYLISQKDINNILFTDIEKALVSYMNDKLKSADPEEYSQKLSPKQLGAFFRMFKEMIPVNIWENFGPKDMSSEAELRNSVKDIINLCRNY